MQSLSFSVRQVGHQVGQIQFYRVTSSMSQPITLSLNAVFPVGAMPCKQGTHLPNVHLYVCVTAQTLTDLYTYQELQFLL